MLKPEPNPFKLDGKPFKPNGDNPTIATLIKILEALPDHELLSTREVCRRIGYSYGSGHTIRLLNHPDLTAYTANYRRHRYLGNLKTIAEFRQRLEEMERQDDQP